MANKNVTVTVVSEQALVWLDDAEKPFMTRPGTQVIPVSEGVHDLSWRLRGAPDTHYSVEISSPDESKFKIEHRFVRSATLGTQPFKVGGAAAAEKVTSDGGNE